MMVQIIAYKSIEAVLGIPAHIIQLPLVSVLSKLFTIQHSSISASHILAWYNEFALESFQRAFEKKIAVPLAMTTT